MTVYVADIVGPPHLKMWIYNDNIDERHPSAMPTNQSGWCFVVEEAKGDGTSIPIYDGWELNFEDIVKYPPNYYSGPIDWYDEDTGSKIDLPAR